MKIQIDIPNNNIPERIYTIRTFLGLFSALNKIELSFNIINRNSATILHIDNQEIIINDSFWTTENDHACYINTNYLPIPTLSSQYKSLTSDRIIILYGNDIIKFSSNRIVCEIDIFASVFFMLSRWEEQLQTKKDIHERYPISESIAFKYNFTHRPIVNEYVELFKTFIKKLNIINYPFRERKFEVIPTHDIDSIFYRTSLKAFLGDLIKRRSLVCFFERALSIFKDPVMTFDYLMENSEKANLKSHFYFMATNGEPYDPSNYTTTNRFTTIINNIKRRGHIIGFHAGYTTFNNHSKWSAQYNELVERIKINITEGRQHYLRWDSKETKQIWSSNNMNIDSTLGYSEKPGFRCGTGDLFPIFDVNNRRELSLNERPLILMDTSFSKYNNAAEKCSEALKYYKLISEIYCMPLTILFHNSNFTSEWKGMKKIYSDFIQSLIL